VALGEGLFLMSEVSLYDALRGAVQVTLNLKPYTLNLRTKP